MPGSQHGPSIKNPKVYDALRRKGMSKTRAARISNAQMHKDAGTMPGAMLSGPSGLLATPGMGSGRKWGNRRKDKACTCGVNVATKESLGPGITRIRGNLCNVHGRYGPCDAALSGKKKPKAGRGRKPRAVKPKVTPEQRAAERAAQQAENRKKVLGELGIAPDGQQALEALRSGQQPDAAALERGGFVKAGLVEQAADGSYRLTASGRAALNAANAGDTGRAGDIISAARDRKASRTAREEAAAQRKRDAEAKRAAAAGKKPKAGAGGGSKEPGSAGEAAEVRRVQREAERQEDRRRREEERQADRAQRQREHAEDRARRQQERDEDRSQRSTERAQMLAERRRRGPARVSASRAPIVKRGGSNRVRSSRPVQTTKAEEYGGIKRSKLDDSVFAGPDRSFPIKTAQDVRNAVQSLGRTKHDKAAVKRGIIRRARAIGAVDALPDSWREKSYSVFAVFKDDTDAWRWVARTTTAYRDRDGEIITTKALEQDAQRMTQTRQYGPLRYWHIGQPDPFDPLAPWGNGLDIGECDYSIVIGRTSIESGTFKSFAIGKAFAEHASDYELSPGFFHPPDQPNAAGEYDNIRRFERSVVPIKYGRASNLFTGLTVKDYAAIDVTYKRSRSRQEEKAMFAKMGGGGGGGGGSKLWPRNPTTGKREPPGENDVVPVKSRSIDATDSLLRSTSSVRRLTSQQETSLHFYQSQGHEAVNHALRGGPVTERQMRDAERTTKNIDPLMRRSRLTDNIEAHRGMLVTDDAGRAALARMQPGATLRERGYMSTSIDPAAITRFGGGSGWDHPYPGDVPVTMRVRVRAGTRGVYMPAVRSRSAANAEKELLIDRGAVYRVVGRREINGRVEVEIEVLGHDE